MTSATIFEQRDMCPQRSEHLRRWLKALLIGIAVSACRVGDSATYTLYRSSVLNEGMRIHVATFDALDGEDYNRDNCEQARELFQAQPGVTTKFWCEKGRYRK